MVNVLHGPIRTIGLFGVAAAAALGPSDPALATEPVHENASLTGLFAPSSNAPKVEMGSVATPKSAIPKGQWSQKAGLKQKAAVDEAAKKYADENGNVSPEDYRKAVEEIARTGKDVLAKQAHAPVPGTYNPDGSFNGKGFTASPDGRAVTNLRSGGAALPENKF